MVDLDLVERWSATVPLDLPADGVVDALTVPEVAGLTPTWLLRLRLLGPGGEALDENLYWLSTTPDVLGPPEEGERLATIVQHADLTALAGLPPVALAVTPGITVEGPVSRATVVLDNPSEALAFAVRARIVRPDGAEVLPTFWSDSYVAVFPGEPRVLTAEWRTEDAGPGAPAVAVDGWNVAR